MLYIIPFLYLFIKQLEAKHVSPKTNTTKFNQDTLTNLFFTNNHKQTKHNRMTSQSFSVQLYSNDKVINFQNSFSLSTDTYFHGIDITLGSTMNLLEIPASSSSLSKSKSKKTPDEKEKFFIGSVVDFDTNYVHQIRRNSKGEAIISSTLESDFPESKEELLHAEQRSNSGSSSKETHPKEDHYDIPKLENTKTVGGIFGFHQQKTKSPHSIIDIMVIWTKRTECAYSDLKPKRCRLSKKTKTNIQSLVKLAIQETNTAFALSGIEASLNLVHSYRHKSYVEHDFDYALEDLTYNLRDVKEKRIKYGADVVVMMIDEHDWCGYGWYGPKIHKMFSVTSWWCATGHYSFGHELGHNFGCWHDRGSYDECDETGYRYGYKDPKAKFRDIMSYDCDKGRCGDAKEKSCSRAQMFSNNINKQGNRIVGNDFNNCARRINEVRDDVASFYTVPTTTTSIPTKMPKKKRKNKTKPKSNRSNRKKPTKKNKNGSKKNKLKGNNSNRLQNNSKNNHQKKKNKKKNQLYHQQRVQHNKNKKKLLR